MPNTAPLKDFQKTQYAFTAHIRSNGKAPAPGDVEDRRMAIYRELLFNNVSGFITKGFPVIRTLYCDADWEAICRDFFDRHRSHTPYFRQIGEEFIAYVAEEMPAELNKPFLAELAHYEYMEVVADFADTEVIHHDDDVNWLSATIVLSEAAFALSYQYPVHNITAEYQPQEPPEHATHLVVYRDSKDDVGFMEINAVTARLLQLIQAEPLTGQQLIDQIAQEMQHPNPESLIQPGLEILQSLHERDIISPI